MVMLKLNNLTIPVRDGGLSRDLDEGGNGRRWRGQWQDQKLWKGRRWNVETPPMLRSTAEALELWLLGRSTRWPFETDFYSDSGKAPSQSGLMTTAITNSPVGLHFGTKYLSMIPLFGVCSTSFVVPTLFDGSYTLSWWQWIDEAGYDDWHHVVERFDHTTMATTYLYDNVDVGSGFLSNYTVVSTLGSGGTITLEILAAKHDNTGSASVWLTDVVMSPWAWTDAMCTAVFTSADRFGAAPRLNMQGDLLDAITLPNPLEVRAEVKDVEMLQGRPSGSTWQNNMRRVAFTLTEVVGSVRA
jgi:hypothetical protein